MKTFQELKDKDKDKDKDKKEQQLWEREKEENFSQFKDRKHTKGRNCWAQQAQKSRTREIRNIQRIKIQSHKETLVHW